MWHQLRGENNAVRDYEVQMGDTFVVESPTRWVWKKQSPGLAKGVVVLSIPSTCNFVWGFTNSLSTCSWEHDFLGSRCFSGRNLAIMRYDIQYDLDNARIWIVQLHYLNSGTSIMCRCVSRCRIPQLHKP